MKKPPKGSRRRATTSRASRHVANCLKKALASHQAGDLSTATRLYQEVISANPRQAVALHHLGLIAHQQGRSNEAVDFLEQAVAIDDGNVAGWTNLGNFYQESGQLAEATKAYRKAIHLAPEHATALYNLGWVLKDSGDSKAAVECFHSLLRITPEDPEIWHGLGLVLDETDDQVGAEESFRKAIELNPRFSAAWYDLGNTLGRQERLGEALEALQAAVCHEPGFAEAHNNLGNLNMKRGQSREAIACFQRSIEARPDHAETYHNLGLAYVAGEDLVAATRVFKKAISLNQEQVQFRLSLGEIWIAREEYAKAEASFQAAVELEPSDALAHSGLGNALLPLGRAKESEAACRRAIELDGTLADAYANLGSVLKFQSKLAEAIDAFSTAIKLNPHHAAGYNNLGQAYVDDGNFEKATVCYQKVREIDPEIPEALVNLALLRLYSTADKETISDLTQILERNNLRTGARAAVHFSLGKIFDDCGRYDEAFVHYARGNEIKAQGVRFDQRQHVEMLEMFRRTFTPELFSRFDGYGKASELPVFIVGMPRSGTSLVEQIVASHPSIHGAGELMHISNISQRMGTRLGSSTAYPEVVRELTAEVAGGLAQEYLAALSDFAPDATRISDKMPQNFLYLGMIAVLFPNARVIHCKRDARDVCLSNFFSLYEFGQHFAYRLSDLALYYREYEELMDYWSEHLSLDMFEVVYEELVNDQEAQTQAIIDFMGVPWDERCLQFYTTQRSVQTLSNWQVRQPLYNRSIERWQRYRAYLGELFDGLEGPPTSDRFT